MTKAPSQADLLKLYDAYAGDVSNSAQPFFRDKLSHWFRFLDSNSFFARPILQQLEPYGDVHALMANWQMLAGRGISQITFPEEPHRRLGSQLLLFRKFASGELNSAEFGLLFLHTGSRVVDSVRTIITQIFVPFARELRQYLETRALDESTIEIPAADRVVGLDHNSPGYIQTIAKLDEIIRAVETKNDYENTQEKERRVAELKASRELLKPRSVRARAIEILLVTALSSLTTVIVDESARELVRQVIDWLLKLIA